MVGGELPFKKSTAEALMVIARHPVISNSQHVGNLPPSWGTLAVLSQLPEPQIVKEIEAGNIHAGLERNEAKSLVRTHLRPPTKEPAPVEGKYRVLYVDPPWQYSDTRVELEKGYGPAEKYYRTLSFSELCELTFPDGRRVEDIAEGKSVLFLWVTAPLREDARAVYRAWGFEYKTDIVWDKVKHNYGHYTSVRHEYLLICTRGGCLPESKTLHDSVVQIERTTRHSKKPEYFRQLIDELYPTGNRIELFARKPREGWD